MGAEASDEAVRLYLPCGSDGDMYPVERTRVPEAGDERVTEVLRLYLAGPTAEERDAGFSSLLSRGDIDIVQISARRVVLDFPSEVTNVSTSAGSRAVPRWPASDPDRPERHRGDRAAAGGRLRRVLRVDPGRNDLPRPDRRRPCAGSDDASVSLPIETCERSAGAYRVTLPEGWWANPEFEDD